MGVVFFHDDTPVRVDIDLVTLHAVYHAAKAGHIECRVKVYVRNRALFLDVRYINEEKTFGHIV